MHPACCLLASAAELKVVNGPLLLAPCRAAHVGFKNWRRLLSSSVSHRPLVLGQRISEARIEYCIASEDCAFGPIGFQRVRDIAPGEMLVRSMSCSGKSKSASH